MTTYVIRGGFLVEKPAPGPRVAGAYVPDIAAFTTTDGAAISSRSHLRDYERRNGVRQIGDMARPVGRREH